ncbi:MAG: hypothetical protein WCI22_13935, partial [Actinomycetota bacterium]
MKVTVVEGIRRRSLVAGLALLALVVGATALMVVSRSSAGAASTNPLTSALARVKDEGSYHFTGDVVAVATPSAAVANAGTVGRSQHMRLAGDTDVVAAATQLTSTTTDGNGVPLAAPSSIRSVDGVTSQRTGEGTWSVVPASGSSAATLDLESYVRAARDVVLVGEETLGGQSTTKYSFALDAAA